MEINFTIEEYFEELKLMEQQYGHEEELYVFINMLLRMGCNTKDLSIRSVASACKDGELKKIIKGERYGI